MIEAVFSLKCVFRLGPDIQGKKHIPKKKKGEKKKTMLAKEKIRPDGQPYRPLSVRGEITSKSRLEGSHKRTGGGLLR